MLRFSALYFNVPAPDKIKGGKAQPEPPSGAAFVVRSSLKVADHLEREAYEDAFCWVVQPVSHQQAAERGCRINPCGFLQERFELAGLDVLNKKYTVGRSGISINDSSGHFTEPRPPDAMAQQIPPLSIPDCRGECIDKSIRNPNIIRCRRSKTRRELVGNSGVVLPLVYTISSCRKLRNIFTHRKQEYISRFNPRRTKFASTITLTVILSDSLALHKKNLSWMSYVTHSFYAMTFGRDDRPTYIHSYNTTGIVVPLSAWAFPKRR